jgi:hypothetical protein
MRNILIITVLLVQSFGLIAQEADKHEIKLDFLQLFAVGNLGVQYEGFTKNNQSFEGSVNYFSFSNYWNGQTEGASVHAAYRMYFNEAVDHKGFFVGPYMKYRYKDASNGGSYSEWDNNYVTVTEYDGWKISSGLAVGIFGGYKWTFGNNWLLEVNGGIGRFVIDKLQFEDEQAKDYWEDNTYFEDVVDVKGNIILGWRF